MSYITLQELQNMEKEKERCKNTYPDWKDDKFNCLDNKFIFAIKSSEDHSDEEPSFHTLNNFTVYYNRKSKLYFIELDLPENVKDDLVATKLVLDNLRLQFRIFLIDYLNITKEELEKPYKLNELDLNYGFDLLSAPSLKSLYMSFGFLSRGFWC